MRFVSGPTGVAAQANAVFSDENLGTSSWKDALAGAIETGRGYSGTGLLEEEQDLPDRARSLEFKPQTFGTARGPITTNIPQWRYHTEEETFKAGDTLATDQKLWEAQFPTVPYEPGMTVKRGIAIKDAQDRQLARDQYMRNRPITSFIGQLIGGAASPENFIPIFGELGTGLKVGRAAQVAIAAARTGAEGAVGTAAYDILSMQERAALGQDTSWKQMATDIAFGTIIGGTFGGAIKIGGTVFNVPGKTGLNLEDMVDTPENRAQANVIMNDAIGSFLNSPNNAVELSPQSYHFLQSNLQNIPQEAIRLNWDHLTTDDVGNVQRYTEAYILHDPGVRDMMYDTKVATESGAPKVIYAGSPFPITGRLEPDYRNIIQPPSQIHPGERPVVSAIWFSDDPNYSAIYSDLGELVEGQDYDVYHGTTGAFDVHSMAKAGTMTESMGMPPLDSKEGIFTATNPKTGSAYAQIQTEMGIDPLNVSPVTLSRLSKEDGEKYKALIDKFVELEKEYTDLTNTLSFDEVFDAAGKMIGPVYDLNKKMYDLRNEISQLIEPTLDLGANVRPSKVHLKNPMIVTDDDGSSLVVRAEKIKEAKAKGHDGLIIKNTEDLEVGTSDTIIAFRPDQIRSRFEERAPRAPNMMPALVDMKNPMIVSHTDLVKPKVKEESKPAVEFTNQVIKVENTDVKVKKLTENTFILEIPSKDGKTKSSTIPLVIAKDHVMLGQVEVPKKERNQGHSTTLYEAAIHFANDKGLPLRTPAKVQQFVIDKMFDLMNKGYKIKQNPAGSVKIKNGIKSDGWTYEITMGSVGPSKIKSAPVLTPEEIAQQEGKLTEERKAQLVEEAKKGKDANGNKYDGLIIKDIVDEATGKTRTDYATWKPDSVMGIADASHRRIQEAINEKMAYLNQSSNAARSPGYSYNPAPNMPMLNTTSGLVNLDSLAKEANITKRIPDTAKAEGMDIETGTTERDAEFKTVTEANTLHHEQVAELEEADLAIRRAGILEQVMQIATGCV